MSENEHPRNERRRSSRGRRRRSGGGDRSPQAQPQAGQAPQRNAPSQGPQNGQRPPRNPRQSEKRNGNDRGGRRDDAPQGDRGRRSQRRPEGREAARNAAPAPAKERYVPSKPIVPVQLPKPLCPRCGSPIEDLHAAMNDRSSGMPIHFDCVIATIVEAESMAEGEKVVYLGGGRFGIVQFDNPADLKRFRVRKTLQWEEKDKRADWRKQVTELYSST